MGAANLDDVVEGVGLAGQRRAQGDQGGQQLQGNGSDGRQVHGAREDIIARLAEVDLIVGMDETALPPRTAEQFAGPVGQHLVDIHVGLGARACLPDAQWKLFLMQAAQDFIGGAHDGLGRAGGQQPLGVIDPGASRLDAGQGADELGGLAFPRDVEVEQGALGLGAPQPFGWHLYLPEAVVFDPYRHRILPSNKTRGEGRSLAPYSMANRR